MNTSLSAMSRLLSVYSPKSFGDINKFIYDGCCLAYQASENSRDRLIYVDSLSNAGKYKELPGAVCYIYVNEDKAESYNEENLPKPAIVLDTEASVQEVFGVLLQNFFHRNRAEQKFQEKMLSLLANGAGMATLLKVATEEYGNPFIVFDSNFSLVAHSVPENLKIPEAQQVVNNRYANVEVLQKLMYDGTMDMIQHMVRPKLVHLPNGYDKLVVNIFDDRQCVGMIGFYSYMRPIEENDYAAVDFVAKLISSYFQKNGFNASVWTPYDYVFNYLLTNKDAPSKKTLDDLKVSFPPSMRLMSLSFSTPMQMQELPLKFIENSIAKKLPKCRTYIYAQSVLVLCKTPLLMPENNEEFFEFLEEFLNKYHINAGISNSFSELSDFRKVYDEATSACSIGPLMEHEKPYFFYVDYTVHHMLKLLEHKHDIRRFCHPAFAILREYDKQYNTQYSECLMAYLKFNGNMNECANYFAIHYNSIKYRMKVIQEVCGIDLHDTNTFLHLYLSYVGYMMFNKEKGEEN